MLGSAQSQHEPYSHEDQKKHGQKIVKKVKGVHCKEGSLPHTTLDGDCPCTLGIVAFNADFNHINTSYQ